MSTQRIKFFPLTDLITSYNIELIDDFVSKNNLDEISSDINTVIECSNILKYINAGVTDRWDIDTSKKLKKIIGIFFNSLKTRNLQDVYDSLDSQLEQDFWELFNNYKLYKEFTNTVFLEILLSKRPSLSYILSNKDLVNFYDKDITIYILSDDSHASVLISYLELNNAYNHKELYFPKSLDSIKLNSLFEKYINSDNPNLNYLELIISMRNRDNIQIDDKIRVSAKKRVSKETELLFSESSGIQSSISVKFTPDQKEAIIADHDNRNFSFSYDSNWIKENLDYPTLLNNFIYLFGFVDDQMRIYLTSNNCDLGGIENAFTLSSKNNYKTSWSFNFKENVSNLQLYSYINLLNNFNIELESIMEWFYSDYMKEEFQIENFHVNLPSKHTTYLEKCRMIAPEIESILKKYNLYVENNRIDYDLLTISSKPKPFSEYKSILQTKYIYPKSKDFTTLFYFFFSDQCMLNYISKEKKSYKTFFDVLSKRRTNMADYSERLQSDLNWLKSKNYIIIENDGEIKFSNPIDIYIIKELYYKEVIAYDNTPKMALSRIDEMIKEGLLEVENSLFSRTEIKYFNYYLNKSEFGNSLDLRNMYAHGTNPHTDKYSNIHKFNYYSFMKILILVTIKINDDLCNRKYI